MSEHKVWSAAIVMGLCLLGLAQPAIADDPRSESRARPTCKGKVATIVGTSGDDTLHGTRRADVIVTGDGDDSVDAKGGADRICTGKGDDSVIGGPGSDIVVSGPGSDIVLGLGGDDQMYGGGGMDGLLGMSGNDVYHGDSGVDIAAFLAAPNGVTADLHAGRARGDGTDSLVGIEALMGSSFADHLLGDENFNALFSGEGADVLDGRAGNDYILMGGAPGPVEIDLGDDRFTGGGRAPHIENVVGSPFDDTIYGDSRFNYLDGAEGNDAVDGIDGSDLCIAETTFHCRDFTAFSQAQTAPATDPTGRAFGERLQAAAVPGAESPHALRSPPTAPPTSPLGTTATIRPRVIPRSERPAAAGRGEISTRWGFTSCPMLESEARIGTYLIGSGYFISQASLGFGGYTSPRYSRWMYFDANNFWIWDGRRWFGPYSRSPLGANYYQWTEYIGATNTAYGAFHLADNGQTYSLGSCNGNGIIPGLG